MSKLRLLTLVEAFDDAIGSQNTEDIMAITIFFSQLLMEICHKQLTATIAHLKHVKC